MIGRKGHQRWPETLRWIDHLWTFMDGVKFVVDLAPVNRRPSDSEAFTIVKGDISCASTKASLRP